MTVRRTGLAPALLALLLAASPLRAAEPAPPKAGAPAAALAPQPAARPAPALPPKPADKAPAARPAAEAPRQALQAQLEQEKANLARLKAQLQRLEGGPAPAEPAPAPPKAEAVPAAPSPLLRRPSLAAADLLYSLGRYAEARTLYEALAKEPKARESDRTWALLQAGNCCRRLRDFNAAIECFQQIIADYPDSPWSQGHVAWALRAAQWEKRWDRLVPQTGE